MTSLSDLPWPRCTERLLLRPASPADVPAVWGYRRLREVNEWLTAAPADLDGFTAYFARPERLSVSLLVTPRERPGDVIGDLMLRVGAAWAQAEVHDDAQRTQAELGWAFAPSATGRGLATEAVRELLRLCFDDLGLRRVEAACFAANEPSWRLMERLGMRRESYSVLDGLHRSGEWMDGLAYALLVEEWRSRDRRRGEVGGGRRGSTTW